MSTIALIVAAGTGTRFGADGPPKQYHPLGGQPVLRHALRAFTAHPRIDGVRTVIRPDDRASFDNASAGLDLLAPVDGGSSRQESVRQGLESLAGMEPARVLIHDGARPFPTAALIDRVIDALSQADGAIPALPVRDTLKQVDDEGRILDTVPRDGLWRVQTPQGFRYGPLLAAHRNAPVGGTPLTDDAAVAEAAGLSLVTVAGDPDNVKITGREDLDAAAAALCAAGRVAVGSGFDVHRVAEGDHVRLCGVDIPAPFRLDGHSDADVGLHALTDALLGALAAGDIGSHFPPSDPQWKGADSAIFLDAAVAMVAQAGGAIEHADVTLICEQPKIGPHREAMQARLAGILGIAPSRLGIKATTSEGLGFTGRGEGIAAQATATLRLPR